MPEGFTPLQGVAVVQTMDEEGQLRVQILQYGNIPCEQAMGLLVGALDVVRGQFRRSFGELE
ncbi:MAG: hypothetical protein CYG60_18950 [Actinobacteria bacterium]|nr:MAG: hypothetical protein CYG60_18950 [Actinomycetota bacterium]